jgi:hypothetical protein
MSLLVNLNQQGFLTIKNDRQKINDKINDLYNEIKILQLEIEELDKMKYEFDYAYERLKDFYEPKVTIKKIKFFDGEYYQGKVTIEYPQKKDLKVKLGNINKFKGIDDPNLILLAEKEMKELIKKEFPIYF